MATLRQIEANRRNAQKSTGPTSVAGKARSSMNALKTGLHAKSLVLSSENVADLEEFIAEYYDRHAPATPEARHYVDELVHCEWLLRRYRAVETQMWQYQDGGSKYSGPQKYPLGCAASLNPDTFSRHQYRVDATRRAYQRAFQSLKQLEAEAAAVPPPPPAAEPPELPATPPSFQTTSSLIGFVPPTPSQLPGTVPPPQTLGARTLPAVSPLTPPPARHGCPRPSA
jgi:hypothetical protein